MNILNFMKSFSPFEIFKEHVQLQGKHKGTLFEKCPSEHHDWLKGKKPWPWKSRRWRTSLRSVTMREASTLNDQVQYSEFFYKLKRRYFGDRLFNRLTLSIAKIYSVCRRRFI
jgi:hypothetical protein